MALPLPRAAAVVLLLLLAAPLLCAAQEDPISPAPSPGGPAADGEHGGNSVPPSVSPAHAPAAPHDGEEKAPSPPAPTPTEAPPPALSSPHSPAATPTPAPAPTPDADADDDDDDAYKKEKKAPAPSPAAMMVKSDKGADEQQPQPVDGAEGRDDGMSGGKKAGVVVGAFSAAAVVGLAAVVYRKRQANIRRSRYADYSARLELV